MVMSRMILVGAAAILLTLAVFTVYAVIGANARESSARLSFTELRIKDAEKGSFDRHDANVLRNMRVNSAGSAMELDRHDRNVMRYLDGDPESRTTGLDRHDRNVMRYIQVTTR